MTGEFEIVSWPVLRFGSPNCTVLGYRSKAELCTVTFASLKTLNRMNELFFVDSSGRKRDLVNPQPTRKFSRVSRLFLAVLNPSIEVTWEFWGSTDVDLGEFKTMVHRNLDEYPGFWGEFGLNDLRQLVRKATDYEELIRVFL